MADASFDKVSLLLHCDESYQTNSAYDHSLYARRVDLIGGCALSSAQSKFGGKSLAFSGSGQYATSVADSGFNAGTEPFTFECWVYPTSTAAFSHVMGQWGTAGECSWHLGVGPGTDLAVEISSTGGYETAYSRVAGSIVLNAWNHVAVAVIPGVSTKVFVGGVLTLTFGAPATVYSATGAFTLGRMSQGQQFSGYIDEVRVTKGVARYSTSFSVPTAAFDPNTPLPPTKRNWVNLGPRLFYGDRLPQAPLNAKFTKGNAWKWEVQTSGLGRIAGIVTIENIPGSRKVRLYRKHDGMLMRETWSAANGAYSFENLDPNWEYFVVSHDHLRVHNAVVSDMIDPP